MITMTRDDYERLKKWENNFHLAIKANFVRMSQREFGEFAAEYNKLVEPPLTQSQMGCNTCRLNALKRIGEEWFKWDAAVKKQEEEKKNNNDQPKKTGRPKKIKME